MIVFFSGGSQIAETARKRVPIMLSYYVVVNKKNKPNSRLRVILSIKKKRRLKSVKR